MYEWRVAQINRARPMMIPTESGTLRDRFDSVINKRLEERIRQLQMIRAQITDIQLRNKRDLMAKQIEVKKILDKLRRIHLNPKPSIINP
jgi:hypothetical protein